MIRPCLIASALAFTSCSQQGGPQTANHGVSVNDSTGDAAVDRSKWLGEPDAQQFGRAGEPEQHPVHRDLAAFRDAAGNPPVVMDFDDLADGTDVGGRPTRGLEIIQTGSPLIVVQAMRTQTPHGFAKLTDPGSYHLLPTSGSQVLSPGGAMLAPGPDPNVEEDDLIIRFDDPVAAVGFDFLSQSADGMAFTSVTVIADDGCVLYHGGIDIASQDAEAGIDRATRFPRPGADFWGFVSDQRNIREIRIDEGDSDASCPDSNIGLDTIRFAPAPAPYCGDLNGDGAIDQRDLDLLLADMRRQPRTMTARWPAADVNRDDSVDDSDLALVLESMLAGRGSN